MPSPPSGSRPSLLPWKKILPNHSLNTLTSQGFPKQAAKHALAYTSDCLDDARDLLIHQSHIRGWKREAVTQQVRSDAVKSTRIGGAKCSICMSLLILRDAGGIRSDNIAYKLYGSRHAVRTNPPPGADAPTGAGWILIPSSSGRGFYIVDPELKLAEGKEGDGEGNEASKRIDGDGGGGNPRWGDCEHRPNYYNGSVAGIPAKGFMIQRV